MQDDDAVDRMIASGSCTCKCMACGVVYDMAKGEHCKCLRNQPTSFSEQIKAARKEGAERMLVFLIRKYQFPGPPVEVEMASFEIWENETN